jgi:hypothetical protein
MDSIARSLLDAQDQAARLFAPGDSRRFSIRHGNPQPLRAADASGRQRHWILEIHLVDRARQFGGFYEELLTI